MNPAHTLAVALHDCPDCLSDTNIVHLGNSIHIVQISHDDHCPTLARIEANHE